MADRRLVVAEADPTDPHFGKMFAVAPNVATGVPIPAFKFGQVLPPVGTLTGEAFYELTTKKGWVWTGAAWKEIAANPLATYPNDAALLGDNTQPVGTYAISTATGNLYVKRTTGWHFVGIQEFATINQLLAATPTVGAMGVALDEDSLWVMTPTGWRSLSVRHFADTAGVLAWDAAAGAPAGTNPNGVHTGDQAVADDVDVLYARTANGWRATSIYAADEATIRAATWAITGQEAISTDTGRTFTYTGTAWIEEPIQHYATEALLLAATVPDGVMAWADDTNVVFTRAAGLWHRLQGPQITVGTTAPSTPGAGDQWLSTGTGGTGQAVLEIFDGAAWQAAAPGQPIGTVIQSILTGAQFNASLGPIEAAKWAMADGRSVAGSKYAQITGNNTVPDLRGAFLRMSGTNVAHPGWFGGNTNSFHEASTGRPSTDFTTDFQGNHIHQMSIPFRRADVNATWAGAGEMLVRYSATTVGTAYAQPQDTSSTGNHQHSITGGGDTETAPKHYSLNYFIRIN